MPENDHDHAKVLIARLEKLQTWLRLTLDGLRPRPTSSFGISSDPSLKASPIYDPLGQLVYTNSRQVRVVSQSPSVCLICLAADVGWMHRPR